MSSPAGVQPQIQVVFMGERGGGKTSLIRRMTEDRPPHSTIGTQFNLDLKPIEVWGRRHRMLFMEVDDSYAQAYSRNVFRVLQQPVLAMVLDISHHASMFSLLQNLAVVTQDNNCHISHPVLVGTKADLRGRRQCIPHRTLEQFRTLLSDVFGVDVPYIEVSAADETNIEELKQLLFQNFCRGRVQLPSTLFIGT